MLSAYRSHEPRLGVLALSLLAAVACGNAADLGSPVECESDGDCPRGQACNTQRARCAPLVSSALTLEVIPPHSRPEWVRKEFVSPRMVDDNGVELRLDSAAVLEGRIQASDRPDEAIPARIVAARPSLLHGRPPVQFETTTVARETGGDGALRFSLPINPGHRYGIQVLPRPPADTTLPCREQDCLPGYPSAEIDAVYIKGSEQQDVVLDGPGRSVEVRGRIVDAAGLPFPFSVRVRASSATGARSSLGATCSAASREQNCDCDDEACLGEFRIRVPQGVQNYTLRIDPMPGANGAEDEAATLVPSLECQGLKVPTQSGSEDSGKPFVLAEPIRFPAFPLAHEYQATVLGGQKDPVAGAQVTFVTRGLELGRVPVDFSGCEATFQRSGITDAAGRATLRLLPGGESNRLYQLAVSSPAQSIYTSLVIEDFEVGRQGGTLGAITLDRRMTVSGRLLDHRGQPLGGTTVEAQGITPRENPSGAPPAGSSSAISESDGTFVLPVDAGAYNLNISPPVSAGIPSFSVTAMSFDKEVEGLVFEAPKPTLAIGRVTDSEGRPAANVTVQAYDLISASVAATDVVSIARGSTITGEDGRFRLVLP